MVASADAILAGDAGFLVMVTLIETTPSRKFWADAGVTKRAHSNAAAEGPIVMDFPFGDAGC